MSDTCPIGFIRRKAYSRRTSTGKTIKVGSNCIEALSQSGEKRSDIDKEIIGRRKRIHKMARTKFGSPKCSKGEIIREGYKRASHKRSSYTKRSGSKIKATSVKGSWTAPICIKAVGNRATNPNQPKQTQLFVLEKDMLHPFGYHNIISMTQYQRHHALNMAGKSGLKPLSIYRRLIALSTLHKNTNPEIHDILLADAKWFSSVFNIRKNGSKAGSKRRSKHSFKRSK